MAYDPDGYRMEVEVRRGTRIKVDGKYQRLTTDLRITANSHNFALVNLPEPPATRVFARLTRAFKAVWEMASYEIRYWSRPLVVLALALTLSGCALSTQTVQHKGTVSLAAAHGILVTLDDAELKLVCGRPGSPQAPYCVPVPVHQKISVMMSEAYRLHASAAQLVRDLGVSDRLPTNVYAIMAQVQGLISAIVDLIPQSPAKQAVLEKTGVGGVK